MERSGHSRPVFGEKNGQSSARIRTWGEEERDVNVETRFLCWVIRWVTMPSIDMENTRRGVFYK